MKKNETIAQEIQKNCLEYFNGDELAASVIINKYLLKDADGNFIETHPDQLIQRLVSEFSRIEKNYPNPIPEEEIKTALDHFKYIVPAGSPLFGIGNSYSVSSISNCFFVGQPLDTYTSIIMKDLELANIYKRRGGVGIDISSLRPSGAPVNNAAKTSDGLTCFMERYSNTTKEVAQNGRRGALMISVSCDTIDIEKFINIKREKNKVTGANLSIKWNDDFLSAAEKDEEYVLRYPVDVPIEKAKITKTVKARDIFNLFVKANWESAEPGCFFWDRVVNQSLSDCYEEDGFTTGGSNPCGEIGLNEGGNCCLMSLNLTSFVKHPFTDKAEFDYHSFEKYVRMGMKLIDDQVDLENEKINLIISKINADPEPQELKDIETSIWKKIKDVLLKGRRVGLGVMGLGDMLAYLNMKYDSDEALKKTEKIFKRFHEYCMDVQTDLAKDRGKFKCWNWDKEKDCHYIKILSKDLQEKIQKHGRRNISITTVAPTGSLSILTQTTSGIEPCFNRTYSRRRKLSQEETTTKQLTIDEEGIKWVTYEVNHHGLELWKNIHPNKKIENSPYWGVEAGELDWKFRIKQQSVIQKYITHNISSTVNLKKEATEKEIYDIYMLAWKEGCKGITIYRDGCRKGVLERKDEKCDHIIETCAPPRPQILQCDINYSGVEGKSWVFFVGLLGGRPYDIFGGESKKIVLPKKYKKCWIKKNGKDKDGRRIYDLYIGSIEDSEERMIVEDLASVFSTSAGSYTRMISTMLRHGVPIKYICEQLNKDDKSNMFCLERVISKILKRYIKDGELASGECPTCHQISLQYRDGCVQCMTVGCGWSKCG